MVKHTPDLITISTWQHINNRHITTGSPSSVCKLHDIDRQGGRGGGGGEGTPYKGLHEEAPPKRGTFFRLQVYERLGISQVEVYKSVGKLVI